MKTDVNGCSTTAAGQEQWEEYTSISGREMVQYDYRTPEGKLFSCVAPSLEAARARRDAWLVKQSAQHSVQPTPESGGELPAVESNCRGSAPAKSG